MKSKLHSYWHRGKQGMGCMLATALMLGVLAGVPACRTTGHSPSAPAAQSKVGQVAKYGAWKLSPTGQNASLVAQRLFPFGVLPNGGEPLIQALKSLSRGSVNEIEPSFDSEKSFLDAVERELRQAYREGWVFGPRGHGALMFGVQTQNTLVPLSEDEAALVAIVTSSTNSAIQAGDVIIACAGDKLMPGRDMAVIAGIYADPEMSCGLSILRDETILTVTAKLHFVPMAASEVLARRCVDAIEAAILNRTVDLLDVRAWWKGTHVPTPERDHLLHLMAKALHPSCATDPGNCHHSHMPASCRPAQLGARRRSSVPVILCAWRAVSPV